MAPLTVAKSVTLAEIGASRLASLCRVVGYDDLQTASATDIFKRMAVSWGTSRVARGPRFASDITDDHTPFEFSLALTRGAPELRFLLEVQGEVPSVRSNWEAAKAMNGRLAADFGAHLDRLLAVEDLFVPDGESRRFAMWHAVCLQPGRSPDFKIYLNPQARGRSRARVTVEAAMSRLGFGSALGYLPETAQGDEICYFSLDLSARAEARVKVYTAHHRATLPRIKAAVSNANSFDSRRVREFCVALGAGDGPYTARPVLTCLSFVQGHVKPTTGTVHFPVRSYVPSDAVARDRVRRYLDESSARVYAEALDAFADRRLDDGVGMQTYVSLRLEKETNRITVYLAPEAYDISQVAVSEPRASGVVTRAERVARIRVASR